MISKFILDEPSISYAALDTNNTYSLIKAIKRGIDFSFFEKLTLNFPFSLREWSQYLHLSERSMQRYKKEKGVFNALSSEKIIEITMLIKFGTKVFGDQSKLNIWLQSNNVAMGNIIPKSLLDSSFGIQMLKDELIRIEHGTLA